MNTPTAEGHTARNLTRNQSLVFDTLSKADGPLSAYDILDRLRDKGFRAPLQVYRALDKLLELGLVHRLESLNAFIACAHPDCDGHETTAFAICETCGQVDEFSDAAIAGHLKDWAGNEDFRLNRTIIELRGRCAACRSE